MIIAAFAGVVYVFMEHFSYNISVTYIGFTLYSKLKKDFQCGDMDYSFSC